AAGDRGIYAQPMLETWLITVPILVVGLPRLLDEIMSGIIAGESGLKVVGNVSAKDVLNAIATLRPSVVVIGGESDRTDAYVTLIQENHPQIRIISLDAEGQTAKVYEAGRAVRRETDISPKLLLEMLRG